jgi:hypothetical protein
MLAAPPWKVQYAERNSLLKCWKLAGEDILDDGFPDVVRRPLEG